MFNGRGRVVWAAAGYESHPSNLVNDDLPALETGCSTIDWDGGEHDPQAAYNALISYECGWQIVAEGGAGRQRKLYPGRMGRAAQIAFGVTDDQ